MPRCLAPLLTILWMDNRPADWKKDGMATMSLDQLPRYNQDVCSNEFIVTRDIADTIYWIIDNCSGEWSVVIHQVVWTRRYHIFFSDPVDHALMLLSA